METLRSFPGTRGRQALSWAVLLLLPLSLGCATASREVASAPGGGTADYGLAAPATEASMAPEDAPSEAEYSFADTSGGAHKKASAGDGRNAVPRAPGLASPEIPPSESPEPRPSASQPAKAPLLIYTATLTLGVMDVKVDLAAIEKLARDSGGYLVARSDSEITIRIPAEGFNHALDKIAALGDEFHREVRVEDVTAQFRDLELRLENAKAVRARLEQLLEKATNVSEAIQVEHELARVSGEIESMQGKLKLYRELIAFSTITVRFQGMPVDQVQNRVALPFPWLTDLGLPNLLSL